MKISTSITDFKSGKTGLYSGIPASDYFAHPACNNSSLTTLADRSPEHCKEERNNPKPPTAAKIFGSAFHKYVLEYDGFTDHYLVSGTCQAVKKDKTQCTNAGTRVINHEWYCGVHSKGKVCQDIIQHVISTEDFAKMNGMSAKLKRHKEARLLMNNPRTQFELTALWIYKPADLLCKIRIDIFCEMEDHGEKVYVIGDLKTTLDASPKGFEGAITQYQYDKQGSVYKHGMESLGFNISAVALIPIEKEPPYGLRLCRLLDEDMDGAWIDLVPHIHRFAKCQKENDWPGYDEECQDAGVRSWLRYQREARQNS